MAAGGDVPRVRVLRVVVRGGGERGEKPGGGHNSNKLVGHIHHDRTSV
jgi:hypothetical protein